MDYWTGTDFEKQANEVWHANHDRRCIRVEDCSNYAYNRNESKKTLKLTGQVLIMKFSERAKFADVVTNHLCTLGPEMITKVAIKMLTDWTRMPDIPPSQYIANFTLVITKLPEGELKASCLKAYKALIPR